MHHPSLPRMTTGHRCNQGEGTEAYGSFIIQEKKEAGRKELSLAGESGHSHVEIATISKP